MESADNLTNAKNILAQCSVANDVKEQILDAIKTIGYSKRLKGIKPKTLEGMIVSDAEMCDGVGIMGILRSYQYNLVHGNAFFDKDIYPTLNMSADDYMTKKNETAVNHIFEKSLKLKDLMLTDSGKKEVLKRHKVMVEFLYNFFEEENVPEWIDYLDKYLDENK